VEAYVVNISSMKDFYKCRYRWACKWLLNRVPRNDARPLRFGKLLHLIFEDFHLGKGSMGEVIQHRKAEWAEARDAAGLGTPAWSVAQDAIEDLEQMTEPLLLWHDTYQFDIPVLEVESPYEMRHPFDPSIILRGRPDRVAVMDGLIWHVQNRGLAAGTNFGLYTELAKRHYHEHVYTAMIWDRYKDRADIRGYGGTFFNLMRKLKYRTKVTKANPLGEVKRYDEMFLQHPMSIDLNGSLHYNVMECVLKHARAMREVRDRWLDDPIMDALPAPNEDLNGGAFGNSRDDYFRVLVGEISLMDDQYFKDREDTYHTAGGGEQA
jgi:hypothetical protein